MFGGDVSVFSDFEVRRRFATSVCSISLPLLSTCELFFEHLLNFKNVDSEVASENRSDLSFGEDRDVWVITLRREERRNASRVVRCVVICEFGEGKQFGPVRLLVVAVNTEILLE